MILKQRDLTDLPLTERPKLLKSIKLRSGRNRISEQFNISAADMVSAVRHQQLEGVVAKRKDSLYEAGKRTGSWAKMRINKAQEFVIGGFIPGPHGVDSIIVGYFRGKDLLYIARVRNGFVPATRDRPKKYTKGCFVKSRQGWILDLYPNRHGTTLWLIDRNQSHYRLTDSFAPAFYVSGDHEKLVQLQDAARNQTTELRTLFTERTDLWLNAPRSVLEVSVLCPTDFMGWGRWVHKRDSRLQLYNSDLMVASLYCWEKHIFPLAYVEVEADDEGQIQSIQCRDDEWALNYEMPPLKIMQIWLAGLSRIDPTHGRRAALEIEMDGTCWELAAVALNSLWSIPKILRMF